MDKLVIMKRLKEHYDVVKDKYDCVGIFLQGSQNYGLDIDGSDIDSKVITLPTFNDFALNKKPVSYTHVMENDEHVDLKDIRLMFNCFRKQNINFIEILFTDYMIINPRYESFVQKLIDNRERIARYNIVGALSCMKGMALEKRKALTHPYPATLDKIERFGYDPKQIHHILRIEDFIRKYVDGRPYSECLIPEDPEFLKSVKRGEEYSLDEALAVADLSVATISDIKDNYLDSNSFSIDSEVDELLDSILLDILKLSISSQLS